LPFFGFESSVGRIEGGEKAEIGGVRVERERRRRMKAMPPFQKALNGKISMKETDRKQNG
jgi:hypothetical protein